MSASRSSLPCSTSCITEVQTNSLEIEPGRNNVVLGSTGVRFSTSEKPKPRSVTTLPFSTTVTTAPARSPWAIR